MVIKSVSGPGVSLNGRRTRHNERLMKMYNRSSLAVFAATLVFNILCIKSSQGFVVGKLFAVRYGNTSSATALSMNIFNEGKKALVKRLAGDFDEVAIKARINNLIKENKVLMLSFTTCPFCLKAKACLDAKNAKYTAVELDKDPDGKAIRAVMADLVGRTSVPAIWIEEKFVGGCNDGPMGGVLKLDEAGKLDEMLKAAGAI